jgi:hypothetical protein
LGLAPAVKNIALKVFSQLSGFPSEALSVEQNRKIQRGLIEKVAKLWQATHFGRCLRVARSLADAL